MDTLSLRAAAAAVHAVTGRLPNWVKLAARRRRPRALDRLLAAKAESDRRNYPAKHSIMRDMIREKPHDFGIDSESHGIVGITHRSTNFRMHLPRRVLPVALRPLKEE